MRDDLPNLERAFLLFRRTGAPDALARVFDATAAELLRVAAFLVPRSEVEDLLHDTFVVAIGKAVAFDPNRPLLPWLLGILANEARMRRRAAHMRERERLARPPAAAPEPSCVAGEREAAAALAGAIDGLDRDDRTLLQLHFRDELSCREIAERLHRPAGTVRTQVARAMGELRRRLPVGLAVVPWVGFGDNDPDVLPGLRARVLASTGGAALVRTQMPRFFAVATAVAVTLAVVVGIASRGEVVPAPLAAAAAPPFSVVPAVAARPASPAAVVAFEARTPAPVPAPEWAMRGRVATDAGMAIPAAEVSCLLCEGGPVLATTTADEDGRYELDLSFWRARGEVDRSGYRVVASAVAPGHGPRTHVEPLPLRHEAARPFTVEHDFVLTPSATLRGRVVDAAGRGVAAAIAATERGDEGAFLAHGTAAVDGLFRIAVGNAAEGVRLVARDPVAGRCTREILLVSGVETDVGVLVLDGGLPLRGRVLLADGTAVPGLEVRVRGGLRLDDGLPRVGPDYWYSTVRTDADGRFLASRPTAMPWSVTVERLLGREGEPMGEERWMPAIEEHAEVLLDAALVELRWFDAQERPLLPQPTAVSVFRDGAQARAARAGDDAAASAAIHVLTTRDEVLLVPTGTYLWLRGTSTTGTGFDELVELPARAGRTRLALRFHPVPAARLTVQVRFADGGVPNLLRCRAQALPGASPREFEVTGNGAGVVTGIGPVGPIRIAVSAYPEFYDEVVEVRDLHAVVDGDNVVDMVLQRRGVVRLLLRDATDPDRTGEDLDGEVRAGAVRFGRFFWQKGNSREFWGSPPLGCPIDSRAMLPVGRHVLSLDFAGFVATTATVDVREGEPVTAVVWLQPR